MEYEPTPESWARLLAGLAAGQEAAFAELYQRFGRRLYRTALSLAGRPEDAEDCVQEVFAALVRAGRRLSEVRDLPAYLFSALRREAVRRAARRGQQPASLVSDPPGPDQPPVDPRREALAAALKSLPLEQREVIALKIEAELTFAEIGRVLSISANTAASRYRYALVKLRERMRDC